MKEGNIRKNGNKKNIPDGSMRIALGWNIYAIIDKQDAEEVCLYKWRCMTNRCRGRVVSRYAITTIRNKTVLLHRFINKTQEGLHTDHINGNGLDCRRSNLRAVSCAENSQNRVSVFRKNKMKYQGISEKNINGTKRYDVRIHVDGRQIYLGRFAKRRRAAEQYDYYAIKYYGEKAHINYEEKREEYIKELASEKKKKKVN
ncbi:MAG: hypothetical protein GY845_29570 [Planctomycetes bacterium]|nr:hypothetical protein [Planctomycetota bacterium]